jgi:DNA-binding Xre family transcriptional regulator
MISYVQLREKVRESGLRWQDVKEQVGLSNEVIAKINKDDYITLRSLERFAEYFCCDIGDLVSIKKGGTGK